MQELDDGRIFNVRANVVFFFRGIFDFDVIKIEIARAGVAVQRFADAFACLVDQFLKLVCFNDNPVNQ